MCDDDDDDDCPPELVTGSGAHEYHAETHENDSESDDESDGLRTLIASYKEHSGNVPSWLRVSARKHQSASQHGKASRAEESVRSHGCSGKQEAECTRTLSTSTDAPTTKSRASKRRRA